MKYFLRKIFFMKYMYRNVKDDECRKKELIKAFKYIALHPYLLFVCKRFPTGNDSVMKNVNAIVNVPYQEEFYQ